MEVITLSKEIIEKYRETGKIIEKDGKLFDVVDGKWIEVEEEDGRDKH